MTAALRIAPTKLILAAVGAAIVVLLFLHRDWFTPQAIESRLGHHAWAPAAFVLAHIAVGMSFVVPRTVMGIAAGLLFGFWWGLALTVLGSMLGAAAAFGLVRMARPDAASLPYIDVVRPWLARIDRSGWRGVWALRLLPVPHSPLNYGLGFTSINWTAYLAGSFLGMLPMTIVTVAVGAAGGGAVGGSTSDWLIPTLCGVAALALSFLIRKRRA